MKLFFLGFLASSSSHSPRDRGFIVLLAPRFAPAARLHGKCSHAVLAAMFSGQRARLSLQPLPARAWFTGDHKCAGCGQQRVHAATWCGRGPPCKGRWPLEVSSGEGLLGLSLHHAFPLPLLLLFFLPQTMALGGHGQTAAEPGLAPHSLHL